MSRALRLLPTLRALRALPALAAAATLVLALGQPPPAHAFGAAGHQFSAELAAPLLNPRAAAQVQRLLKLPLRTAATWADCVKQLRVDLNGAVATAEPRLAPACIAFDHPDGIERMADHVRRHPCHPTGGPAPCHLNHHFTDISIAHDRYDRAFTGSSAHDIVSALNAAIAVLRGQRGQPAPPPFSFRDPTQALLLLVHLVGDLHQPLHVGAIYLDADGQPFDPDARPERDSTAHPPGQGHTQGGNLLDTGARNLHAEWDAMPASLGSRPPNADLLAAARHVAITPGDVGVWPTAWASETLAVARTAFAGLSFHPDPARPGHWQVRFADRAAYERHKDEIQILQLTRAGARLAQVLNALWP